MDANHLQTMTANPGPDDRALIDSLVRSITPTTFQTWYKEQQFSENIRTGRPYFNSPPSVKAPEEHTPSQLFQCHRKIYYRQLNAPEEREDPDGIFWTGTKFEEEVVLPYLEDVAGDEAYVRNSIWVDYTVETSVGEVRIRGMTDPVLVDAESKPLLPTEVKTKQSIANTTEPNDHHIAQLYAYLEGLSREWNTEIRDGLVIYADRTTLEIKVFHVQFSEKRWERLVQSWVEKHTQYRLAGELPPADPVFGWECNFCSFKDRCGKGSNTGFKDIDWAGFVPGYTEYPREKVVEYLLAHPQAKLTPTLATRYRDLVEAHGVHDWRCEASTHTLGFEEVDWNGDTQSSPVCPTCASKGILAQLGDPTPEDQQNSMNVVDAEKT